MVPEKCQKPLIVAIITAFVFFMILGVFGKSQAAGLLKPKTGGDSQIAIRSHDVKVVINNGFARTQVDQVFERIRVRLNSKPSIRFLCRNMRVCPS